MFTYKTVNKSRNNFCESTLKYIYLQLIYLYIQRSDCVELMYCRLKVLEIHVYENTIPYTETNDSFQLITIKNYRPLLITSHKSMVLK